MKFTTSIQYFAFLLVAGIFVMLTMIVGPARSQATSEFWDEPENLSNSGSASQIRIVVRDDGRAQAFWMDEFDGLMTSVQTEDGWSDSQAVGIAYRGMSDIPMFVLDAGGNVHAFWLDAGAGSALWHSRAQFGIPNWSLPEVVAEAVLDFDVAAPKSGGLSIAYIRPIYDEIYPAGVYARRWWNEGYWGMPNVVDSDLYYRQWQAEETWLRLADTGDGRVVIAWQDPRRDQAYYSYSKDYGVVWSDKSAVGEGIGMQFPRLVTTGDEQILMLSEVKGVEGCSLYQQRLDDLGLWGAVEQGLTGLSECPDQDSIYSIEDGFVWVWGQGSNQLWVAVNRPEAGGWSEARSLDFPIRDSSTDRVLNLIDQRAAVGGGRIYLTGSSDESGDVWTTWSDLNAIELMEMEPARWTESQRLSGQGQAAGCMSVAIDSNHVVHVVWCEGESSERPTQLYYAQWDNGELSKAVALVQAEEGEIIREPSLAADPTGWIHLVWSGGENGEILYSRAQIKEALSRSVWSEPKKLSQQKLATSPQLAIGDHNDVFVLYVVSVNEGRGVYLAHSKDGGVNWIEADLVFNAASADVGMIVHPGLLIETGTVHVSWVEQAGPDLAPIRILYLRGKLIGESQDWSKPTIVMWAGYDWPQFAVANGALHLVCKAEDGALWSRSSVLTEEGWGTAVQVPGWPGTGSEIFGLSGTGSSIESGESMLHLVGASPTGLAYGQWKEGRWNEMEEWEQNGVSVGGVRAAALRQGGNLSVIYSAVPADGVEAIYLIHREVEAYTLELRTTALPTPTAVPDITPMATVTSVPTPTPDLNLAPPPGSSMPIPLMLGGGLALLVVIAGMAWGLRDKTSRRKDR